MDEIFTQQEHDDAVSNGAFMLIVLLVVCIIMTMQCCGCSTVETGEYDYAGPDGTLTGVPWELNNYVVEDHDTGVYYFLLINDQTNDMALCPRYNLDGTLWENPLHKEVPDEQEDLL